MIFIISAPEKMIIHIENQMLLLVNILTNASTKFFSRNSLILFNTWLKKEQMIKEKNEDRLHIFEKNTLTTAAC